MPALSSNRANVVMAGLVSAIPVGQAAPFPIEMAQPALQSASI
jgi:hypothetical protein